MALNIGNHRVNDVGLISGPVRYLLILLVIGVRTQVKSPACALISRVKGLVEGNPLRQLSRLVRW